MKHTRTTLSALAGALLAAGAVAFGPARQDPSAPPPPPSDASRAVWDLLHAQPFRLAEPATHSWRAERPSYRAGHLLVLAVDPAAVVARQVAEPVLYVGDQTARRVNVGAPDGALVVIVPDPAGPDGWPARELAATPVWFGAPALPEEVDAAAIARARAEAEARGLVPFGPERVAVARATGGAGLDLRDVTELEEHAARLVQRYAPSEVDLVRGLLVPRER